MDNNIDLKSRANGAELGAYIGDALSMPVHWYYDQKAIFNEFGLIDSFRDPRSKHSGSIIWRSEYNITEPGFDILGTQRKYWGLPEIHYHQFLKKGENTLNLKLLRLALIMVSELGRYDRDEYIERYVIFMLDPDDHRDTYIEECHRGFFKNLKNGISPGKCAVQEKHIGGMVSAIPLYAQLRASGYNETDAAEAVHSHVSVTHAGGKIKTGINTLLVIAEEIIQGISLEESLLNHLDKQDLEYLRGNIRELALTPDLDDLKVLGPVFGIACYLEDSLPASFFLALKYADSAEKALIQNTMAGGDNCHRGAVIGALAGLAGGEDVFPRRWRDNPEVKKRLTQDK